MNVFRDEGLAAPEAGFDVEAMATLESESIALCPLKSTESAKLLVK